MGKISNLAMAIILAAAVISSWAGVPAMNAPTASMAVEDFANPPASARPWVYWFIMDGNLTREGITSDFEAMRDQGIGGFIMMEVNVGVPRGTVDFMSNEWQQLFVHIVREAERCGLQMTLPSGPGWAGSGGPWIKPEDSMWHLVAAEHRVNGPTTLDETLPTPKPRTPFFGENGLPPDQEKARREFFRDVCVMAFSTPSGNAMIADIDEKADYVRAPYSSQPGVKPRISAPAKFVEMPADQTVDPARIIDLTDRMTPDGRLTWEVPDGDWTILRFAATSTGANTRPAPAPGMGLESSKMDRAAFDIHAEHYIDRLLEAVGPRRTDGEAGWCYFHIDSWEMGPQNYSPEFFREFERRRGYDPTPYLPAYTGRVVGSVERTERFLWDLRQTAQELILENHAEYLRDVAHRSGLGLSLEFYDMMPCCDMTFGAVADVPMCEFWSNTFDTVFSGFEAASIANTHGKPIVAAEAFTSGGDGWRENPRSMKRRTDWAFCTGINRLVFHRFQHQPLMDQYPGFSMGSIGVHWEQTQTWWPLAYGYHTYLTRCQNLLRQGHAVVDVLYLIPEGAPSVFTPPASALLCDGTIRDQRGYRFDGCDPDTFLKLASVEDGQIVFPNATRYRLLVLPAMETMTLPLLEKIERLVYDGAVVVGPLPQRSPGLSEYPTVDTKIQELAAKLRGDGGNAENSQRADGLYERKYGAGTIYLPVTAGRNAKEPYRPLRFDDARWIWYPEGSPAWDAPEETRYFRRSFTIPTSDGTTVRSARLIAVADNDVVVTVNGRELYRANLQDAVREVDFASSLKPGENRIEISATNGPNTQRNPAGLVAMFRIETSDTAGRTTTLWIPTDAMWETSHTPRTGDDATASGETNNGETAAMDLGGFGTGPWGRIGVAAPHENSGGKLDGDGNMDRLYPEYDVTSAILAERGVRPDFVSDGESLRFYHRHDARNDQRTIDYYFVANRHTTPYDAEVAMRVTGKTATIFDPLTGRSFRAPPHTETDGMTRMRLTLEGAESVFVIFTDSNDDMNAGIVDATNAPVWRQATLTPLAELNDGWTVRFDPRMGGPVENVTFDRLTDWSTDERPAIRFYSGIASYERSFTFDPAPNVGRKTPHERVFLDLGEVEVMAEVQVNGELVGTRWVTPYRFEITDAVREGLNTVSIRVANLWPNRLIGDAALPESERVTWSTWRDGGYHADSPLLPSGLLGAVLLLQETAE